MRCKWACAMTLAVVGPLTFAAAASASTLGVTTQPSGSTAVPCGGAVIAQGTDDSTTPYHVPAGGGQISQWQTVTTGDTPGTALTFAVLRSAGGSNYTVVGADSETVPNPLPSGGVATYPLATPIQVRAGDTLALYAGGAGVNCYFDGGSTPAGDSLIALTDSSPPPSAGQTITMTGVPSPPTFTLNVAATLGPGLQDAAVTTSGPSRASAGQTALLSSTVTNNGPDEAPITFRDTVPPGMTIDSAVAGGGSCSVSSQTVTCTISGLATGQSAPVAVVATPSSPGSYTNNVSVAPPSGWTDPNTANSSASATFNVGLSLPAKCVVPKLKAASSSLAKTVLTDLGCRVKTTKAHSNSVRKGSVVKTKPGHGTYPYHKRITVVISSGPRKRHHK
jgi:uncharacterized repeat protein (TIGR01451 family)